MKTKLNWQGLRSYRKYGAALVAGCAMTWLAALQPATHAQEAQRTVSGHVLPETATLVPMGPLPATDALSLTISLPLRNQAVLDDLLRELYNPMSPRYRRFLSPAEFTQSFGPTLEDYEAIVVRGIERARFNGVRVEEEAYLKCPFHI
jgi:pro-kumamolisin-like protein